MSTSKIIKKQRTKKNILGATSLTLSYGPLLSFMIYGIVEGSMVQKVALPMVGIIGIGLSAFSIINKKIDRSVALWSCLILFCLFINNVAWIIYTVGGCSITDSLVVSPLYKKSKTRLEDMKSIDKVEKLKEKENG